MGPKPGFYAVKRGRETGIFRSWAECEKQVKGFSNPAYKKFNTFREAEAFVAGQDEGQPDAQVATVPDQSTKLKRKWAPDINEDDFDIVYTDGACKKNGASDVGPAGVGVFWGTNDPRNIAERCPGEQTNNRAELIAILRVLEESRPSTKPLLIKTDSNYSIQCIQVWYKGWERNGFRSSSGEPVKNQGIIKCIKLLLELRALSRQTVRFEYVKGHSGHFGNDGADEMANLGAMQPPEPERDWAALEKHLRDEIRRKQQSVGPSLAEGGEHPTKMIKLASLFGMSEPVVSKPNQSSSIPLPPVQGPEEVRPRDNEANPAAMDPTSKAKEKRFAKIMKAIADPQTDGEHQSDATTLPICRNTDPNTRPTAAEPVTPHLIIPPKVRTPPRTFICNDSEEDYGDYFDVDLEKEICDEWN